jgi:hypothetical protein
MYGVTEPICLSTAVIPEYMERHWLAQQYKVEHLEAENELLRKELAKANDRRRI